jgi:hypothetical protein
MIMIIMIMIIMIMINDNVAHFEESISTIDTTDECNHIRSKIIEFFLENTHWQDV